LQGYETLVVPVVLVKDMRRESRHFDNRAGKLEEQDQSDDDTLEPHLHLVEPIAFAGADVDEHALGVDVAHLLQVEAFAQTQAAGVNGGQADPVIKLLDFGQDAPHFLGREDHGKLELGIGWDQLQLARPLSF
jgi:hypothetical protein